MIVKKEILGRLRNWIEEIICDRIGKKVDQVRESQMIKPESFLLKPGFFLVTVYFALALFIVDGLWPGLAESILSVYKPCTIIIRQSKVYEAWVLVFRICIYILIPIIIELSCSFKSQYIGTRPLQTLRHYRINGYLYVIGSLGILNILGSWLSREGFLQWMTIALALVWYIYYPKLRFGVNECLNEKSVLVKIYKMRCKNTSLCAFIYTLIVLSIAMEGYLFGKQLININSVSLNVVRGLVKPNAIQSVLTTAGIASALILNVINSYNEKLVGLRASDIIETRYGHYMRTYITFYVPGVLISIYLALASDSYIYSVIAGFGIIVWFIFSLRMNYSLLLDVQQRESEIFQYIESLYVQYELTEEPNDFSKLANELLTIGSAVVNATVENTIDFTKDWNEQFSRICLLIRESEKAKSISKLELEYVYQLWGAVFSSHSAGQKNTHRVLRIILGNAVWGSVNDIPVAVKPLILGLGYVWAIQCITDPNEVSGIISAISCLYNKDGYEYVNRRWPSVAQQNDIFAEIITEAFLLSISIYYVLAGVRPNQEIISFAQYIFQQGGMQNLRKHGEYFNCDLAIIIKAFDAMDNSSDQFRIFFSERITRDIIHESDRIEVLIIEATCLGHGGGLRFGYGG